MNKSEQIIVTGAAGMIGSNLIQGLNESGYTNIIAVDDLSNGHQFINLAGLIISDYVDKEHFIPQLRLGKFTHVRCLFHQGACSATTEWDGRYMMENNYHYSQQLYRWCGETHTPFIYASSASVYGNGQQGFHEDNAGKSLLNVYAYSKWLFDHYVSLNPIKSQVVGLRYFNVYGPNEQHKGSMASVAWHLHQQYLRKEPMKLFGAWDGYEAGQQSRDFIYVGDTVKVNLWFLSKPEISGIFNCGTGKAQPFQDIADALIEYEGQGSIAYIDFPDHLKGAYQSYTQADMQRLREVGYVDSFLSLKEGVHQYMDYLKERV